jgi:Sulfotransferase family
MEDLAAPEGAHAHAIPLDSRPPIIVGGVPRSGTTLMAQLLGSHDDIAVPPAELAFFLGWRPGDDPSRRMRDRGELETRVRALLPRLLRWGLTEEEPLTESRDIERTHRDLFVFLLDLYRRRVGKTRVGVKSVNYENWLYVFDEWFDDYRFAHMVRHPVDTFASIKWFKRGTPRPNKVELVPWIHEWNRSARVALHRSHARPDRYCLVRYEDLVQRPIFALERICRAVGVESAPERMLEMAGVEDADNSSFADEAEDARYEGRLRRTDEIDRARKLDPYELDAVRSGCSQLAYLLGYDDVAPLRRGRGALGQPLPGRIPARVAVPFVATRARDRLRALARR